MAVDSNSVRALELSIFLAPMNLLQAYNLGLPHYDYAIHAGMVSPDEQDKCRYY